MLKLLADEESSPLVLENETGRSRAVLVCEHGGGLFPERLGRLGLSEIDAKRHFVWDLGALDLARAMSGRLDAPLVHQRYSRLICDCNRKTSVPSFIPENAEEMQVPGNAGLTQTERAARIGEIWQPFHDGLAAFLDRRAQTVPDTVLISVHSFTPVFHGEKRSLHVGLLCDRSRAMSELMYSALKPSLGDRIAMNQPYVMSREHDYTIPVHGEDRGLHCAEIELRNDLLALPARIEEWANKLCRAIDACIAALPGTRHRSEARR